MRSTVLNLASGAERKGAPRHAFPEEVPVLDLSPAMDGGDLASLAARLRTACEQTAFFYVVNHGIPAPIVNEALAASHRFFSASDPARTLVLRNAFNRGYLPIGTT